MKSTQNASEQHYVKILSVYKLSLAHDSLYMLFLLPPKSLSVTFSVTQTHTHTPRKHMHFFQLVITQLSYFCLDITSYREMTRTPVSSYVLLLASIAASYTPIITHNTLYGDRLNTFLYLLIDDKLCESRNSIYCAPSP